MIYNEIVKAQKYMAKKGTKEDLASIMSDLNHIVFKKTRYTIKELSAIYSILRDDFSKNEVSQGLALMIDFSQGRTDFRVLEDNLSVKLIDAMAGKLKKFNSPAQSKAKPSTPMKRIKKVDKEKQKKSQKPILIYSQV